MITDPTIFLDFMGAMYSFLYYKLVASEQNHFFVRMDVAMQSDAQVAVQSKICCLTWS